MRLIIYYYGKIPTHQYNKIDYGSFLSIRYFTIT